MAFLSQKLKSLWAAAFAALLAFAPSVQAEKLGPEACAALLLSKKEMRTANITSQEATHWHTHPQAMLLLRTLAEIKSKITEAPAEGLDALALIAALESVEPHPKYEAILNRSALISDLEVILSKESRELMPAISKFIFMMNFVSKPTQEWMRQILKQPPQMFLLAYVMSTFPQKHVTPIGDSSAFYIHVQGFHGLFSTDVPLLHLISKNEAMSLLFAKSELVRFLPHDQVSRVVSKENTLVDAISAFHVDPDLEEMTEWAASKLYSGDLSREAGVSQRWNHFLDGIRESVVLPLGKTKRSQFQNLSVGFQLLMSAVSTIGDEIFLLAGRKVVPTETGLTLGFKNKVLTTPNGIQLFTAALRIRGLRYTLGFEIRKLAPPRLNEAVIKGLRDFYSQPVAKSSVLETSTDSIDDRNVDFFAESILQSTAEEQAQDCSAPASVVDQPTASSLDFGNIQPDQVYEVTFKRPHHKFSGTQQILFRKEALAGIRNHISKEVDPNTWLKALEMGIACAHGQRGIKILTNGYISKRDNEGDLAFELKLLLSPWRVMGHRKGDTWVFEKVEDHH